MARSPRGFSRIALAAALACAPAASAYDDTWRPIDGGAFDLDDGPVPYSLDDAGSDDIDDDSDLEALRDAFRAWSCVPGSALRFVEEGGGVGVADLSDGINTLFWDETDEYGLGIGTLGVTVGDAGAGTRAAADIIFNGVNHSWSTDDGPSATDVGSIAIHEIGHFIGLDHPCDKDGAVESNCNGPDVSIMTPAWDGAVGRVPLPDDEDGARGLYPASDPAARCEGPYQRGERCACDDECVDDLVCVPGTDGTAVCAETCSALDATCGPGFACVLDAPEGDEEAPGACVKTPSGESPPGATCSARGECAEGDCALVQVVGRSVCRTDCDADADCPSGGRCIEGACLIGARSTACPADEDPGCTCGSASPQGHRTSLMGLLVLGALVALRGRRRPRA